jgi:hypothetical protein
METGCLNSGECLTKSEDNSHLINNNPSTTLNELQNKPTNSFEQQQPSCSTIDNTTNQLDSDNYIHELLSDEDLQMIGFSNLQTNLPILEDLVESVDDLNTNLNNLELTNEDRIEVSSDSAISSMSRSVCFIIFK